MNSNFIKFILQSIQKIMQKQNNILLNLKSIKISYNIETSLIWQHIMNYVINFIHKLHKHKMQLKQLNNYSNCSHKIGNIINCLRKLIHNLIYQFMIIHQYKVDCQQNKVGSNLKQISLNSLIHFSKSHFLHYLEKSNIYIKTNQNLM